MTKIAIVFYSGFGHTAALAKAVAEGAESVSGAEVSMIQIQGADIHEGQYKNDSVFEELASADAIIFGSPTYMGDVAGPFKCFLDASSKPWFAGAWKDKVGAAFTISGSPAGDKFNSLMTMTVLGMQQGLVWVGCDMYVAHNQEGVNRLGHYLGAAAQAGNVPPDQEPGQEDLATGRYLGARVARITGQLVAGRI